MPSYDVLIYPRRQKADDQRVRWRETTIYLIRTHTRSLSPVVHSAFDMDGFGCEEICGD